MRYFDRNKVRELRVNRGFSLGMTARLLGVRTGRQVTKSAISQWERGVCTPGLESVLALSELFEVPLDYFFEPKSNYLLEAMAILGAYRKRNPAAPAKTVQAMPDTDARADLGRPAGE